MFIHTYIDTKFIRHYTQELIVINFQQKKHQNSHCTKELQIKLKLKIGLQLTDGVTNIQNRKLLDKLITSPFLKSIKIYKLLLVKLS